MWLLPNYSSIKTVTNKFDCNDVIFWKNETLRSKDKKMFLRYYKNAKLLNPRKFIGFFDSLLRQRNLSSSLISFIESELTEFRNIVIKESFGSDAINHWLCLSKNYDYRHVSGMTPAFYINLFKAYIIWIECTPKHCNKKNLLVLMSINW